MATTWPDLNKIYSSATNNGRLIMLHLEFICSALKNNYSEALVRSSSL